MSVSRDQNFHQLQCSIIVTWYRRHVTMILHCHWWKFWSFHTATFQLCYPLYLLKMLNMICLKLGILYQISNIYMVWYNNDTDLYKFLETGTSGRTLVCLDQLLKCLGFSLYLLSFFFTVPLKMSYLTVVTRKQCNLNRLYYFIDDEMWLRFWKL